MTLHQDDSTYKSGHIPVLLAEVVAALAPRDGGVYVDGTFGRGGYARAILSAADCTVLGIDRDPSAIAAGAEMAREFDGRLTMIEGAFGSMDALLGEAGIGQVDGVTLDLGVSSPQIDDPARGFSFRADGPLDMRMGNHGTTAADAVNTMDEGDLANVIFRLGEERLSRRVARAIVQARTEAPIERTSQLAEIVRRVVPKSKDGIDPATRTFQALRLHVNDELGELDRGLAAAERLLRPEGRLAVVSFHSLEDRQVKEFLRQRSGNAPAPSRHAPVGTDAPKAPTFRLISRKPVTPGQAELTHNPRARSARLRAAERTKAPAFEEAA
ncbi:ribosomal RNA small subunit methyltransferase H [Skermanella aerolata]|uniref:Ribosomal RNA small subunit methyltransferase H n=1 Tax=Skermanella aerolata TaxID=393310 RepID=A0A512DUQ3_9PROT|nr:16S rRNA (cytosine(1402)-N(4))-methyltransferase RsmH [Skermanella aerolata]KJB95075.1 16S rRNA methyltransferase [Skermanella aerolata KACC 11604]GEO40198.1 ribosomal RNA small subunit methyltransferase H [Skermanella aerolata]